MTRKRLFEASSAESSKKSKGTAKIFKAIEDSEPAHASDQSGSNVSESLQDTVEVTVLRNSTNSHLSQTTRIIEASSFMPSLPMPPVSALEESSLLFDEYGAESGSFNPSFTVDNNNYLPSTVSGDDLLDNSNSSDKQATSNMTKTGEKRNRMLAALLKWLPERQTILDEILRSEGAASGDLNLCTMCKGPNALYKCADCFGNYLYCSSCLLTCHRRQPFHRISKFNKSYFKKITLKELGLCIQLGHENGSICYNATKTDHELTVLHTNGIHRISVSFCECGFSNGGHLRYIQLIRSYLFPATLERPSTAITFDCLNAFITLSHTSKTNTYDYYISLVRMTDNIGKESSDGRYHEFSLATRLWRHFCALKRAGRGHDPSGVDGTTEGSLAVICPACPNPGRNLPVDWREQPKQWLYTQFLAIDANFRLKMKDRNLEDLELAPGWAYFVDTKVFHEFLAKHKHESEVNSCRSQHNALLHATTLNAAGYLATGVGAVVCGRHSFVRSNGVTNLQFGERYVNMDYAVLRSLVGNEHAIILMTYDIACQWSKNFRKRQAQFPPSMRLLESTKLRYGVPSFHIAAHGSFCQATYSLNLLPEVGRTYGEGIESQWSHMNGMGTSTREQAPGMRNETLTDHWHAYNWNKIVNAGPFYKKNLIAAVTQHKELSAVYKEFSSTFEAETLQNWTQQIVDWEQDPKAPNPYAEVSDAVTLSTVRLNLAEEEAVAMQAGTLPAHEITASSFLSEGLELEERQRVLLLRDQKYDKQLNSKTATLQESRNSLWTVIEIWRRIQDVYMPTAASLRVLPEDTPASTSFVEGAVKQPETLRLCLPSSMPANLVDNAMLELRKKEARLRTAQADDALSDIRRLRRTMTGVSIFKKLNISGTGQKPNTRVRSVYERLSKVCKRAVERYRAARVALFLLDPDGDWKERLQVLRDIDVSGPQRDAELHTSEGRYKMSWIWRISNCNVDVNEDSVEFSEHMRVEWSRARARELRWKEEIELLTEEMRRIVADLEWRASWWREQGSRRKVSADLSDGLQMYSNKQAVYMHDIAFRCVVQWAPLFARHCIPVPWLAEYIQLHPLPVSSQQKIGEVYDISYLFN